MTTVTVNELFVASGQEQHQSLHGMNEFLREYLAVEFAVLVAENHSPHAIEWFLSPMVRRVQCKPWFRTSGICQNQGFAPCWRLFWDSHPGGSKTPFALSFSTFGHCGCFDLYQGHGKIAWLALRWSEGSQQVLCSNLMQEGLVLSLPYGNCFNRLHDRSLTNNRRTLLSAEEVEKRRQNVLGALLRSPLYKLVNQANHACAVNPFR